MEIRQCKIFESSSVETLQHQINKWLAEKASTIQVLETKQSECAYPTTPNLPSMHRRTITIWYERIH